MTKSILQSLVTIALFTMVTACSDPAATEDESVANGVQASERPIPDAMPDGSPDMAGSALADTQWQLLKIQSMDDSMWAPEDSSRYTLNLQSDGKAYMQFDCNRGNAGWHSEASGHIRFTLVASTNALCQDDGLSERYAAQFEHVRSYLLRDKNLFLATMADGAIIEFQPAD